MRPTIAKRDIEFGSTVRDAVDLLERSYGARLTHDSHHTRTAATWIFDFDAHGGVQMALRTNRAKLSLYLRAQGRDGRTMRPVAERLGMVEEEYPVTRERPSAALLSAHRTPFLRPSMDNRLLRVQLPSEHLRAVMDQYLGLVATTKE